MNTKFKAALKRENKTDLQWYLNVAKNYNTRENWEIDRLKQFISAKNFKTYSDTQKTEYLVKRIKLAFAEKLQKQFDRCEVLAKTGTIEKITINVEWKKSRMWGSNPTATVLIDLLGRDKVNTYRQSYTATASGCGYDKESQAIASALNQCDAFIALLFKVEQKDKEGKLYGYSNSKGGYFPHLSGGVGVSCYPHIFDAVGYKWSKTGWGKTFDCYQITKK